MDHDIAAVVELIRSGAVTDVATTGAAGLAEPK
jgi:hypothetical protein